MKFLNRWLIEGTLTTHTPLRIGDGGVTTRPDCDFLQERKRGKKTGKSVEISSVAVDFESRAYIPATTIKGNLRSWALACGLDPALLDLFFGSENPQAVNAVAGKSQFWNAHAVKKDYQFAHDPPGWDAGRLTAVAYGIAVMRRTRTVREKKLFHQEYVPPGVTFSFALGGNDYEEHDERTHGNKGLLELLILLEGFNLVNAVTLGAEADGLEKGWGRLRWDLATIKRLGCDEVKEWVAA